MKHAARPMLARLVAIDSAIRGGGYPNAAKLARRFEVSHRTVQRDIDCLRSDFSAPLTFDHRHNGYRYTEAFVLPLTNISMGELVALCLSAQIMRKFRGTPFGNSLNSIVTRLQMLMPDQIDVLRTDLAALSVVSCSNPEIQVDVFRALASAAINGKRTEIDYFSMARNGRSLREIDPYRLAMIHGDWYVIGYCHVHKDVRMFAMHRIYSVRSLDFPFDKPPNFCISEYMDGSFRAFRGDEQYRVVLRFTPAAAARAVERHWHDSQAIKRHSDGSITMQLKLNDLTEIKSWVLSWGSECRVVGPNELIDLIRKEIRLMSYDKKAR